MGIGIEVFNSNGTLQFDTSAKVARLVSPFNTGTVDGSVAIPSNVTANAVTPVITFATLGRATPAISRSGNNIVWTFGSIPAIYRADCTVLMVVT